MLVQKSSPHETDQEMLSGISTARYRVRDEVTAALFALRGVLREAFRLDLPSVIGALIFLAVLLPLCPRNTDNPQQLAAFSNDEPFLAMALDATLEWPYGNPSNYFDATRRSHDRIPAYWGTLRYNEITYYGGMLYAVSTPFYAVMRGLGLPAFPINPILLRVTSTLATLGALLIVYNFAKARGSRWVGGMAAVWLASDPDLLYYTTYIHPDTLSLLLGLLALATAARHAQSGDRASLIALGLFCGAVQGTKVGGPWLVPMGVAAIALGIATVSQANQSPAASRWRPVGWVIGRALLLGAAALAGYVISTPYAFLDPYYFRTMVSTWQILSSFANGAAPFGGVSLATWTAKLYDHIGPLEALGLFALALRVAAVLRHPRHDPMILLATILVLSQFLWFGITGGLWVVTGYLLVAFAIAAWLSFETIVIWARTAIEFVVGGATRTRRVLGTAALALGTLIVVEMRWYELARYVLARHLETRSTVLAVGDWAKVAGIAPDSRILFDDLAYFDPRFFTQTKMYGAPLIWPVVEAWKPDYIVLSSSLYDAPWYQELRKKDHRERDDLYSYSMRLYQDLLSTDVLGPTLAPQVTLIGIIAPRPLPPPAPDPIIAGVAPALHQLGLGLLENHLTVTASEIGYIRQLAAALLKGGAEPLSGPTLRIFKVKSSPDM